MGHGPLFITVWRKLRDPLDSVLDHADPFFQACGIFSLEYINIASGTERQQPLRWDRKCQRERLSITRVLDSGPSQRQSQNRSIVLLTQR